MTTTTTQEVIQGPRRIAPQRSHAHVETPKSSPKAPHALWLLGGAVLLGHLFVDLFAAVVPSILGVLEVHCHLHPSETAWLLGIGAFCSGLSQPVCAWIVDRYHWYRLGSLGILLATLGICSIGLATSFGTLLPIYILGMVGSGMFHPIAAAAIGGLSELRRSSNMSLFFVAGMVGGVCGATFAPRLISGTTGFSVLYWGIVPGVVVAWLLHRTTAHLPRRHSSHHVNTFHRDEIRTRWIVVGILYVASVLRFSVNLALVYLFVRWVQAATWASHPEWTLSEVASYSMPMVGNLNACMLLGMGLGGLGAGVVVRHGKERWPLVLCPIVFAPAILLFPHVTLSWGYLLSVLAGIGFAAMIPVSIVLGQRLLPHRTSLASSLMMGGAWAVAMIGPRLAEFGVQHVGISWTFYLTAAALCLAGLITIPFHAFSRNLF